MHLIAFYSSFVETEFKVDSQLESYLRYCYVYLSVYNNTLNSTSVEVLNAEISKSVQLHVFMFTK